MKWLEKFNLVIDILFIVLLIILISIHITFFKMALTKLDNFVETFEIRMEQINKLN